MNYQDKIIEIESSGNPNAVNKKSGATGLMQIMPKGTKGALDDWNRIHPNETYETSDLKNPEINKKIGNWYWNKQIPLYLKNNKIPDDILTRSASYNMGPGDTNKWYKKSANPASLNPETFNWYRQMYLKTKPKTDKGTPREDI